MKRLDGKVGPLAANDEVHVRPGRSAYPVERGQAPEKKHQRPEGAQDGLKFWLARPPKEASEPERCSQHR